jgi:hypothetical protein
MSASAFDSENLTSQSFRDAVLDGIRSKLDGIAYLDI